MKPIRIAVENTRALKAALNVVQASSTIGRLSMAQLFSRTEWLEAQLGQLGLPRKQHAGCSGEIYGYMAGNPAETCTRASLERKATGWFLVETSRVPASVRCYLYLTRDQAELIVGQSAPGRAILRELNSLRRTVEWQPLTPQSQQAAIARLSSFAASDPDVYSCLKTLAEEEPPVIWKFFRAIARGAAKAKVDATLRLMRQNAQKLLGAQAV